MPLKIMPQVPEHSHHHVFHLVLFKSAKYAAVAFLLSLVIMYEASQHQEEKHHQEVTKWLEGLGLAKHSKHIIENGCSSLVRCAALPSSIDSKLPGEAGRRFQEASLQLKRVFIFHEWLKRHGLHHRFLSLIKVGLSSLEEVKSASSQGNWNLEAYLVGSWSKEDWINWKTAVANLPDAQNGLAKLSDTLWKAFEEKKRNSPWGRVVIIGASTVIAALVGVVVTMSRPALLLDHHSSAKLGFFAYVTGKYLAPQNCKVEFEWNDPQVVGSTMTFVIKFFQRSGRSYPICNEDNLLVEVMQGTHKVACSVELGGTEPREANSATVQFTVRRAGEYNISILVGMVHIRGSPFIKHFLPGPPDPQKTGFVHHCSTVVCTEGHPYHLFIEPQDKYNNVCDVDSNMDPSDDYSVDIVEVGSSRPMASPFRWEIYPNTSRIALVLRLENEGCYHATVSYRGSILKNGDFHILVLSKGDAKLVQKNIAKKSHNIWYEARLVSINGERLPKPKKVFCYLSPKQLTIKEYLLKIIPKRLITFRLCPSTKVVSGVIKMKSGDNKLQNFQFWGNNKQDGDPVLIIDDGCQPQVELLSPERNVIIATFTQFLLKNIGGSETFKDKQDFFCHEIRKLHQKHFHDKLQLKILRERLLELSMKATKYFTTSDWCKNFEITFIGEQGIDWGGLRREWFELTCSALFDSENLLFCSFANDKQGLVQPNPKRPPHLKLKHYEFAGRIVGKCLYESALGSSYRQLVKARFSRSFLAQLIGLRVHYKYFEQDDPDLYVSKIKYILEHDVDDMELSFTEEEYDANGQLQKVIELVPGGSRIAVTNQNKLQYLDSLAQFRLANTVKEEVEHFLKGLNDLIPDNLLCIFDENELELLMCGTGHYSIADFKANHRVSSASYEFRKVLDWFWTAVANFSEEEMARLLQFTTGCSQLPPGGFGELNPKFYITSSPTFGNLPTAHTCFNQLCLPDYDSYEQFEQALRLAISEGSEGFAMI